MTYTFFKHRVNTSTVDIIKLNYNVMVIGYFEKSIILSHKFVSIANKI